MLPNRERRVLAGCVWSVRVTLTIYTKVESDGRTQMHTFLNGGRSWLIKGRQMVPWMWSAGILGASQRSRSSPWIPISTSPQLILVSLLNNSTGNNLHICHHSRITNGPTATWQIFFTFISMPWKWHKCAACKKNSMSSVPTPH